MHNATKHPLTTSRPKGNGRGGKHNHSGITFTESTLANARADIEREDELAAVEDMLDEEYFKKDPSIVTPEREGFCTKCKDIRLSSYDIEHGFVICMFCRDENARKAKREKEEAEAAKEKLKEAQAKLDAEDKAKAAKKKGAR